MHLTSGTGVAPGYSILSRLLCALYPLRTSVFISPLWVYMCSPSSSLVAAYQLVFVSMPSRLMIVTSVNMIVTQNVSLP